MYIIIGVLLLLFFALYVVPNIIRYPWHTLVFVVAAAALSLATGAGNRLIARLNASTHPAARRFAASCATFTAIVHGVPPYKEARWWIARTLAQALYWGVALTMALAVLVALGAVFVWLDKQT